MFSSDAVLEKSLKFTDSDSIFDWLFFSLFNKCNPRLQLAKQLLTTFLFTDEEDEDDVVIQKPPVEPEEESILKKEEEEEGINILFLYIHSYAINSNTSGWFSVYKGRTNHKY